MIDSEINSALKNDEKLINLYKSANSDYAKMKNISDSNLMNQISRDGKTSIEALNAMLKSSDNINGVNLNDFLGSLGAKDRAVAEANLIRGLMDKNSFNGVVDFRALNQSLASLDFKSEFAKELKSQILSKQSILNNTSDILNSLGDRVIKSKGMSQGISADPLKRADTMRANFIVEKMKPLIPYLGNNEALKLHLNRAILNANGDFKLAIKNIDNIPSGNLPTPTRNLLNEFKSALKDIEQVVKSQAKKEIRGIHNVTYNDKKATYIKTDLENVDSAIRYANTNRDKGAKHIKIRHLMDETKPGYITNQELLNLGNSLREYIKTYKEPFIDKNGARIYEWENKEGVKFRVVVDSSRRDATTAELPQPTATDDIITFYSDRNIKDKMIFRNPKLNQTKKEAENLAKPQATPKQEPTKQSIKEQELTAQATKEVEINNTEKPRPNTNSRYENIKKFVEGKTNKALDNEIKVYNDLYRGVLDDFARAHPSELNLPTNYHAETANYITKEFLVKYDKEIKGIISQKASGENRQIVLRAFENLKQNFDELRSVGIGDLRKPTAKTLKDELALIEIKSMSDKELVTQYQKLYDSNARVNENLFTYLQDEIKQREKKLYPFIKSDNKDYSYSLEKQLKNRGLMGLKDSDLENIAKERNNRLYLPSYIRENIQKELNINPIKEFGINYAEFYHDGANAIKKLLVERQGQVAGAFERKELGDIDLVWGEAKTANGDIKGYGLSKIEAKHLNDFASFYGDTPQEKLINGISEIIKNGKIKPRSGQDGVNIEYSGFIIGINKGFNGAGDNKWVVTAFDNSMSIAEKKAKTARTDNFTSEVSNLSQNSSVNYTPKELLSQGKMPVGWKKGATNIGSSTEQPKWANKFKTKMEKMGQEYSDEKIANLANWHKDSHAITKEADGSPKVFYHGSTAKFSAFKPNPKSGGIWLTTDIERAHPHYTQSEEGRHHLYKVFVNAKKIYRHTDDIQTAEPYSAGAEKFYNDLIKAGYDAIDLMDKDILIVLKPNQIKSIDNKGTFNPRSKMMNAYTKVELPIALVGGGLGYIGTQSIADGYKNKDTTNQNRAKQYAKFLAEAKEPTQVAPDELYKAYNKAKKDLNRPKNK
ncbi:hypothetical protein [Campylobacter hyointestinalis]|uniref:putative barnase/colicin E5 family endoribonuclease n=1 Tax=Campylobacter hyointestinalis TaxID=198 RepID=UPI0025550A41|nr:hypothetical protein [Campylobacter hyointestinalis]MDL2347435.1 hypothetical protein [Campylobacter hyointestinalis]MDL2349104.1 hypothetical protein [Campylobacter hyointestinalis]MDL2350925.1 hypothetical protein [Campylobacter hyointestinalis]MDM1026681.1 hypothetical protein [Campylobacter hyointestinalis]MDM1028304.1 hypothetical protein [Campylobacter hyointestinalis]